MRKKVKNAHQENQIKRATINFKVFYPRGMKCERSVVIVIYKPDLLLIRGNNTNGRGDTVNDSVEEAPITASNIKHLI